MSIQFFGQDREPIGDAHPSADAAKESFFSYLCDSTTETFETFEGFDNTLPHHYIDISAGRVSPIGNVSDHEEGGVFGEKWIITGDNEQFILSVSFTKPVAAFGIYVVGKHFFRDKLEVTLTYEDNTTQKYELLERMDESLPRIDKLILYWGIIDTANRIKALSFTRYPGHGYSWAFDNLTTATADQVSLGCCHSRKIRKHGGEICYDSLITIINK